eukprot:SAG11_NODE_13626_length_646_cov_1.405850_2_plen_79_part_01
MLTGRDPKALWLDTATAMIAYVRVPAFLLVDTKFMHTSTKFSTKLGIPTTCSSRLITTAVLYTAAVLIPVGPKDILVFL